MKENLELAQFTPSLGHLDPFMPDEVISTESLDIQNTLEYKEHPIRILGRDTKETRSKTIPMCKIQWSNHTESEATWEKESNLRLQYPYLFEGYVMI